MPKIRDLGINTIPLTMRPPEIGAGGGHEYSACGNSADSDKSCLQAQTSACGPSCKDKDKDDDETSGCSEASCIDKDKDKDKDRDRQGGYRVGAFHPEAIAQLRQQLEQHIGI